MAAQLRRGDEISKAGCQSVLLVFDGYACHLTFRSLNLFKRHDIVVAGLPAHTSHALQPLNVGVFGALKEECFQQPAHENSLFTDTYFFMSITFQKLIKLKQRSIFAIANLRP